MEVSTFLEQHHTQLQECEQPVIHIKNTATQTVPWLDPLPLRASKFLGKPIFPLNKAYPTDKKKRPMLLVAHIDFKQIPENELDLPKDGVLQLFFSADHWYTDDVKVIYHAEAELQASLIEDFSFIDPKYYKEMPADGVQELSFEVGIDQGSMEDEGFMDALSDANIPDIDEELEDSLYDHFHGEGHKIGGYATFTQGDPRGYDHDKRWDFQLLQIDSDDEIMFGDAGVAHVFISHDALKAKNFDQAYFYWDCC